MQGGQKAFSEMLNTQRELLTLVSWEQILTGIICSCARMTKEKKYTHFGIGNYAECWSGPDVQNTYNLHGVSNQCISMLPVITGSNETSNSSGFLPAPTPITYELCHPGSLQCAGPLGSVYVYSVENGMNSIIVKWTFYLH